MPGPEDRLRASVDCPYAFSVDKQGRHNCFPSIGGAALYCNNYGCEDSHSRRSNKDGPSVYDGESDTPTSFCMRSIPDDWPGVEAKPSQLETVTQTAAQSDVTAVA